MADRLVLAVGIHPGKAPVFTPQERLDMLAACCRPIAGQAGCEIGYFTFDDLVVRAAQREGATILIRGLRDGTDFDYEMQMAGMNGAMVPDVQTVFLAGVAYGAPDHRHTGAPDRQNGRRRLAFRAGRSRSTAEGQIHNNRLRELS